MKKIDLKTKSLQSILLALMLITTTIAILEHYRLSKTNEIISTTVAETIENINKIESIVLSSDSLNISSDFQNQLYKTQKDILTISSEVSSMKKVIEDEHESFWTYFFGGWTLIGLGLGFVATYFSISETIRQKIADAISKFTKADKTFIKNNIDEFEKHSNLKSNSVIKVLTKEKDKSKLPSYFTQVIELFDNAEIKPNIKIEKLDEVDLNEVDIIVLENDNYGFQNWQFINNFNWNNIESIKAPELTEKKLSETKKVELQTENDIKVKNTKNIIRFINKCGKNNVYVLYYGDQKIPLGTIDAAYKNFLASVNIKSQFYGNLMNLLKFKNELENHKN